MTRHTSATLQYQSMEAEAALRINARLDEETARKMQALLDQQSSTQTEIIKQAIDLYFEERMARKALDVKSLLESDFIGSLSAQDTLSEDYKSLVNEVIDAKYPDHG